MAIINREELHRKKIPLLKVAHPLMIRQIDVSSSRRFTRTGAGWMRDVTARAERGQLMRDERLRDAEQLMLNARSNKKNGVGTIVVFTKPRAV